MSLKISKDLLLPVASVILIGLSAVSIVTAQLSVNTICHREGNGTYTTIHPSSEGEINGHRNHPPLNGINDIFDPPGGVCPEGGVTPTATPEPISMLLFGAGLAGVGYYARRRKQRGEE